MGNVSTFTTALTRVAELLDAEGEAFAIVVLGGAALNLLGIVDPYDLTFFKPFAAVDDATTRSRHYRDLLALHPTPASLAAAAAWVRGQDMSPEFPQVLDRVVAHVRQELGHA